ncbi:MAG: glycogen-binding domain-containing protein [Bacteroidota bacterium]
MRYLLIFCMICCLSSLNAQDKLATYYFEGNEVVFQFDSRWYDTASKDGTNKKLDFNDLDIQSVIVSGQFNDWTRRDWVMKRVGPFTYQLRKKIADFNDEFTWDFKFLINGKYWAEPDKRFDNKVIAEDIWNEVYNLRLYNVNPDDNGNVTFYLEGYEDAEKVILAGDFNGWNEEFLQMDKIPGGWRMTIDLTPDHYQYKFIVDGEWMHDPANDKNIMNEHGTLNSVLAVTEDVYFNLEGYLDADEVILAGSFNDWDEKEIKMVRTENGWEKIMPLVGGKHSYKFIIDGNWITDPGNPYEEYDGFGNINSILIVQD